MSYKSDSEAGDVTYNGDHQLVHAESHAHEEVHETVEHTEHSHAGWTRFLHGHGHGHGHGSDRSLSDALRYNELKLQYESLLEKYRKQSIALASAESRLDELCEVEVEDVKKQSRVLKTTIKTIQAEASMLREEHNTSMKRVTLLEETITMLMSEHHEFRDAVFELLGIEKTTVYKSIREVIKEVRSAHCRVIAKQPCSEGHAEEIMKLTLIITELNVQITQIKLQLEEERGKTPPAAHEKIMILVKEKHELIQRFERERTRYTNLVREIMIYREESEKECGFLSEQLESAHEELKEVSKALKMIQESSSYALNTATSVSSRISSSKHHRCKYASSSMILEKTVEETNGYHHDEYSKEESYHGEEYSMMAVVQNGH